MTGLVFNIQRYSLHDGPGIRTTVFLKGCPLRCKWCHNPEGISPERQIVLQNAELCLGCGDCAVACSRDALSLPLPRGETSGGPGGGDGTSQGHALGDSGTSAPRARAPGKGSSGNHKREEIRGPGRDRVRGPSIDTSLCTLCGACSARCPTGVLDFIGEELTPDELVSRVLKDRIFYDQSGGGVTFSGGEPLYQGDFLLEVLRLLTREGIHSAVDTSAQAPTPLLLEVARRSDLLLCDLKHMDPDLHRHYTGQDNRLILKNLTRLAGECAEVEVRIPLLPGINTSPGNIGETGRFLSRLNLTRATLLPYHAIARDKYGRLGWSYRPGELEEPGSELVNEIAEKLRTHGLNISTGGR